MKKIYIVIVLLISSLGFGQINLTGEANYKLNIKGFQGRINNGCGEDDGLKHIKATRRQNGRHFDFFIFQGRKMYTDVTFEQTFTKNNPIIALEFHKLLRWRNAFGGCTGNDVGYDRITNISYNCFSSYQEDAGGGLMHLTVTSKPYVKINNPTGPQYLANTENLKIELPDNLEANNYKWKYKVGNGIEKDIPQRFNNTSILNIKGEDFLTEADYGKTVSVWLNMNCSAGEQQAKGIAKVEAVFKMNECIDNCDFFNPTCWNRCINNFNQYYNQIYTPQLVSQNQSYNSNAISFTYLRAAPNVLAVLPSDATCYDSQDSSLKIRFGRPLIENEKLNIILTNKDKGNELTNYNDVVLNQDNSYDISNLQPGNYNLQLNGFYEGVSLYSPTITQPLTFEIKKPGPVDFTLSATNILCNGAAEGTITVTPSGGMRTIPGNDYYSLDNGANWVPFPNNGVHTITGLVPGTYRVKVKDSNGCIAKVQVVVDGTIELGEEKVIETTITQPASSLTLNYTFRKTPTFFGAANGKIVASVTGGTIRDDQSYEYEWKNSSGGTLPATAQYNPVDRTYNITLDNVPAGEYKLTVKDKNYNAAVNKAGCSVIESSQSLSQPNPIVITLTETQSISCNTENSGSDANKFSDGIITATVTGGTQPYQYVWSKYNPATNVWDALSDITTNAAQNLSKGNYALNVIDANGITQGTYNTLSLITAVPTTRVITEPAKLELSLNSENVSCHAGNNGWVRANVSGGAAPYTYIWYNVNGGITDGNRISQLTAGRYTVEVTDAKGCYINRSIDIMAPQSPVAVVYKEIFMPTFSGATNGRIVAEIIGGTPNDDQSYEYEWKNSTGVVQTTTATVNDGAYTITLNNVPTGDYFLTVKDKNYNETTNQVINCSIVQSKTTLSEPEPLRVVFEIARSISCNTGNEFGNPTDTTPNDGQRDESQDGILVARVTGGTVLAPSVNNGLPYYFYWKKQLPNGSWVALPGITGPTASSLSHGNYALNVRDAKGIVLGVYVNNQLVQETDAVQFMQEPPKLSVTISKGNVFCNEGNDGWATANVVGGTLPYSYRWSNGVETNNNTVLKAGEYSVVITDAKGCTTQGSVTITQPATPLTVRYTEIRNPGFYRATNGKIVVEVTGGTIFPDNSYWFEWKNSRNVIQIPTAVTFNNGTYTITLDGLPEETYSLTVRDANYEAATNRISCTVANSATILEDPDPLSVTFEVIRSISCNVNNEFGNGIDTNPQDNQRDESQDGILVARVTGGIQLQASQNNGLPYFYTWKKKLQNGSWAIWNDRDATAENLSHGTYALNIEDANGIKLGTYSNNVLAQEIDVVQNMPEPAKLNLTFSKLDSGCLTGDGGWAEAIISGGTPPYNYEWANGAATAKIENITANNYFVIVTDAKGCMVQGSIFVGNPKGILTTETIQNPNCYTGNDGSIQLNVTGGNLPYTYLWNTGATTKDISNLTAGNYEVTITCPDCCVYKKRFVLKDPNPIVVNLGEDKTLCNDQVLDLDATIADRTAQYSWTSTNGFTSNQPKVSLTRAGTYRIRVTSGSGCIGEDEIVVKTSQVNISAEFLLSSQAYLDEEVILINTSNPFGESTRWIVPKEISMIDQQQRYITLKFKAVGTYSIGLQQTQGECTATYSKNITVEQRSTLPNTTIANFITDFIVTPNPSDGNFKAIVNLEQLSPIHLRLFSTNGQFTMIQKKEAGKKKYEVNFNTPLGTGMYILVLETEQQTLVKKIIIY